MWTSLSLWNTDLPSVVVHIRPCQENFIWEVIPGSTAGEGKIGKGKKPTRGILLSTFPLWAVGGWSRWSSLSYTCQNCLARGWGVETLTDSQPHQLSAPQYFLVRGGSWGCLRRRSVELSQAGNYLPQLQASSSQPGALFLFIIIVTACSSQEAWEQRK